MAESREMDNENSAPINAEFLVIVQLDTQILFNVFIYL